MPQCDEHPESAVVRRSSRQQTQCSIDCIPNHPRYVRGTQNDLPQNDRKAPTGIAVNPQAARAIETYGKASWSGPAKPSGSRRFHEPREVTVSRCPHRSGFGGGEGRIRRFETVQDSKGEFSASIANYWARIKASVLERFCSLRIRLFFVSLGSLR